MRRGYKRLYEVIREENGRDNESDCTMVKLPKRSGAMIGSICRRLSKSKSPTIMRINENELWLRFLKSKLALPNTSIKASAEPNKTMQKITMNPTKVKQCGDSQYTGHSTKTNRN